MKKIIVIILVLLLAGCAKISEAEQFIEDNPGVLDGDPVLHKTYDDTTIKFFEVEDNSTSKLLFSVDSDVLIVLYLYCETDSFDATTEHEERIYEPDTYYGLINKPKCNFDQTLTAYYNVLEGNGTWTFIGEIPIGK